MNILFVSCLIIAIGFVKSTSGKIFGNKLLFGGLLLSVQYTCCPVIYCLTNFDGNGKAVYDHPF